MFKCIKKILKDLREILSPKPIDYTKFKTIKSIRPPVFNCDICGAPGAVIHREKAITKDTINESQNFRSVVLCMTCHAIEHEPVKEIKSIQMFAKNKGFKDYRGIVRTAYPLFICARKNGKSTTLIKIIIAEYVKFKNPKIAHLARNAKKYRTRKKNRARLGKLYDKELRCVYEQL